MKNPVSQRKFTKPAEDIGQVRKRASDDADSVFNQVERKSASKAPAPVQAAGGDDDLMSTPRKP